jgi:hypothetical protein
MVVIDAPQQLKVWCGMRPCVHLVSAVYYFGMNVAMLLVDKQ